MPKRTRILPIVSSILMCLVWIANCSLATAQTASPPALSDLARTYVESVISLAQTNSFNRSQIDWPIVRREVLSRAARSSLGRTDDGQFWRGNRDRVPWPFVDAFVRGNDTRADDVKPCVPSC